MPQKSKYVTKADFKRKLAIVKERKYFQIDVASSTQGTAEQIIDLSAITQGAAYNQRSGNTIYHKKFEMRSFWTKHSSATPTTIRFIFFRWMGINPPTDAEILANTAALPNLSPVDFNNKKSVMKVYMDKILFLTSTDDAKVFNYTKTFRYPLKVSFEGVSTDANGKLYLFVRSNQSTNVPSYSWSLSSEFEE